MPQVSYRQVNGPGGPINFPSNMSDSDVEQAMGELYPAKELPAALAKLSEPQGGPIPWQQPPMSIGQSLKKMATSPIFPGMANIAQQSREEAQVEMNKSLGIESQGRSIPNRLWHRMVSLERDANAVAASLLGGASPMDATAMAAGAVDPAIPAAYFATQGTAGAVGIGQPSSVKQAKHNPSPENIQKALFDVGMMVSPMGEAVAQKMSSPRIEVTRLKNIHPEDRLSTAVQKAQDAQVPPSPGLAESIPSTSDQTAPSAQQSAKTAPPPSEAGESLHTPKDQDPLTATYGPPKRDFQMAVPKENLGFDPNPPKDYGTEARADVERRMGGALPRGQAERRGGEKGSSSIAASPFGLAFEAKAKLEKLYADKLAEPVIQKLLKLGRTHEEVEAIDPEFAQKLRELDNGPRYYRMAADSITKKILGGLSRDQERLFVLMADSDSRLNLMMNHPDEYKLAANAPEIQSALKRYKPEEAKLTAAYVVLGGTPLEHDYLRRVYEEHVGGVNRPVHAGESTPPSFERIIRPQRADGRQRMLSAEEHYEKGLHELGPAFGTKYIGTMLRVARDRVARDFLSKATVLEGDDSYPSSIHFNGKQYFSPDAAADMRRSGAKDVPEYGTYGQGLKFYPIEKIDPMVNSVEARRAGMGVARNTNRWLGPKDLTNAMNGFDDRVAGGPSEIKRFFQEQVVGFGFGIPHYKNILRRISQQTAGGIANPISWVRMAKVALSKELAERGIHGIEDPMFDLLARNGAISSGEVSPISNFRKYIGGNLNPANWVRPLAKVGHDFLFRAGGIDQKARLWTGDLVKSQHPEYSDSQIAQAVNETLGNYNRANWTTTMQRKIAPFLLFPGWDQASAAWVIRHPIRTTLPPALLTLIANQVINHLGGNRESDKTDLFSIHAAGRTITDNLLNEPLGKVVMGPALRIGEARLQHKSWSRAFNEGTREFFQKDALKPLGMLRPDVQVTIEVPVNKDLGTKKELYNRNDWNKPGLIPGTNLLVQKVATHVVQKLVPQIGRISEAWEAKDILQFLGSNLGVYNYPNDPIASLRSKAAQATMFLSERKGSVNATQILQAMHSNPDATVFLAYRPVITAQLKRLSSLDRAEEMINKSSAAPDRKSQQLAQISAARDSQLASAKRLDALIEETLKRAHAK